MGPLGSLWAQPQIRPGQIRLLYSGDDILKNIFLGLVVTEEIGVKSSGIFLPCLLFDRDCYFWKQKTPKRSADT